jgi:hypothetical protein
MQGSLAQEANRKAQNSSPPDLLCSQPAVPFMQTPPDEESGAFLCASALLLNTRIF